MKIVRPLAAALALVLGLSLVGLSPASAAKAKTTVITIAHAPTTPTWVSGSGLGTVRTYYVPITVVGKTPQTGYMSGTLTTIATGLANNQELRASNLVFVVGSEPNQLVVGGLSLYPADGATLAVTQSTVRPIIGGSGTYRGARGQVESTNLGDQGWRHVFRIIR